MRSGLESEVIKFSYFLQYNIKNKIHLLKYVIRTIEILNEMIFMSFLWNNEWDSYVFQKLDNKITYFDIKINVETGKSCQ